MDAKVRGREVEKYYLCAVHGRMKHPEGTLRHWLTKKPEQKKVTVLRKNEPGSKEAVTYYQVIDERDGLTLCECLLGTGRTHQIRAHLAHLGYPICGDDRYGDRDKNKQWKVTRQQLWATRVEFSFRPGTCLGYLDNRKFSVTPEFTLNG